MYERVPGWSTPTKGVTRFDRLPAEAQRYIHRLEEVSGVACAIISTGSDRSETIVKNGSLVEKLGWLRRDDSHAVMVSMKRVTSSGDAS